MTNERDTSPKRFPSIHPSPNASERGTQNLVNTKASLSSNPIAKSHEKVPCLTIAAAQIYNETFVPCVVIAVQNPSSGSTKFLVGLLDSGCTGLVLSTVAAEKLGVKTWNEVVTIKVLEETTCNVRKKLLN